MKEITDSHNSLKYWIIFTAKTEPLTVEKAATITANNSDSVISGKNGLINEWINHQINLIKYSNHNYLINNGASDLN